MSARELMDHLADREALLGPDERIAESDRQMIVRMQAELVAADKLRAFVSNHLMQTYRLGPQDAVGDDGRIHRGAAQPTAQPATPNGVAAG